MSLFDGVDPELFIVGEPADRDLRLAIGLDLHFGRPIDDYRDELLQVWDTLLQWRGRDRFTWARLGGGNKSRKMNPAAYRTVQMWLDGSRPYGDHCFINVQDGPFECIGEEAFIVDGNNRPVEDEDDSDINHVQMRFELSVADDPDELAARLQTIAAPLRYASGSAGLMLHATPFGRNRLWAQMRALVTRYEGVEPDMADKANWMAGEGIPDVNWLTFVGQPHLDALGGPDALAAAAAGTADVTAADTGHGIMLRAGDKPRMGDRNHPSNALAPYRAVYRLLKPALYQLGDFGFSDKDFDADQTLEWQQRFERPVTGP